jgi:phosphotransferase family enzyme
VTPPTPATVTDVLSLFATLLDWLTALSVADALSLFATLPDWLTALSVVDALSLFATLPDWLMALADSAVVLTALGRHVPEFASGELELRDCKVERVRLRAGSLTALYRLNYADRATGHQRVVEVLGEIVSPGAAERSPGTNGAPFGTDGWRCYLSELRLDLGLAPAELRLPALSTLMNAERARDFLERAIRADSPAYGNLRILAAWPRMLRPKGNRCTVLHELEYSPEDADSPSPVIAKTYRRDAGAKTYAGMQALWSSKLRTSEAVAIAEPLAYDPELKVLLQGPVRGESTLTDLIRSAFAPGSTEALGEVSAYVDKTALGLAALHTSGVTYGEKITWADRVADVEEQLGWVTALAPELSGAAAPLLTRLVERAAEHSPDPLVPTHGSFRPNQVLLHAGEIGFVDFDGFCQAEPALDVASFIAGLKKTVRVHADDGGAGRSDVSRARLSELEELGERFLQQYGEIANISRERLVLWEALDLFNGVLDCWTKMSRGLEGRVELLRHHLRMIGLAA